MDDLSGIGEGIHAGDADFCCHESEKIGHLAMEVRWLERSRFIFSFKMAVATHLCAICSVEKRVFVNNLSRQGVVLAG